MAATIPAAALIILFLCCSPIALLATVPTPPSSWWVLGPFPDGAREYNADPVCSPAYGNDCIFSLEPGSSLLFGSEFADGGLVNWTQVATGSDGSVNIPFNNIRWDFITAPLGNEMGAQFQGWAVGTFSSDVDQTVIIQVPGLNEIYLDSRKTKFFGDPYSGGVSFAPVHLSAGSHTLYVRLMGAQGTGFSVSFYAVDPASCKMPTFGDVIVTDFVSGVLASSYISIQPVNADTDWQNLESISVVSDYVTLDSAEWDRLHNKRQTSGTSGNLATLNKALSPRMGPSFNITKAPSSRVSSAIDDGSLLLSIKPSTRHHTDGTYTPTGGLSISVAPNQPYPLVIPLKQTATLAANITQIVVQVVLTWQSSTGGEPCSATTNVTLHHRNFTEMYQPYKFSFLDYDQSAQYCVVYPPRNCTAGLNGECSILFTTHGAGVEADEIINPAWAYAYQQQAAAFILLPTNRRNFGFDWQNAGLFNAFSAFQAFVSGMPGIPAELKSVYTVNPSRVLFGGHSMGGHGCWVTSTHFADLALGSAPAAGWIKSELYGPYFLRVGYSHIDSVLRGLLEASFQEYDTDLHITNLLGISVIARMGGADTNVPPWMMRRMARLQVEQGGEATVSEIPGQPHWWGGVVDDAQMQAFYDAHLYAPRPALPTRFTFTCANPNICGTRGGMMLWQLQLPFRVGRINVEQKGTTWDLATENIRRFTFQNVSEITLPSFVSLDGQTFDLSSIDWGNGAHFCQLERYGSWAVCDDASFVSTERNPSTYGPFRTIWLNPILIVYATGNSDPVYLQTAVWLSQYWSYQGRGLVNIMPDSSFSASQASNSNILLLGGPDINSAAAKVLATGGPYPVQFSGSTFQVGPRTYSAACNGLLALLPHPLTPWNNLVGIASGTDSCGFAKAAQMIPIKSGETVTDWQVSGPEAGWKGVGGLLAAGYWNNQWQFEDILSYVR